MITLWSKSFSILFLAVGLAASLTCYSQEKLEVGFRFIPQATSLLYKTPNPVGDYLKLTPYDFRVRTAQGIGAVYHPYKRWSVAADILYSLQGGGYESRKTNIDYLKIPFWLGYNALPHHKVIFNVQVGVDVAWVASAKMRYDDGQTINISPYVNRANWGIPFAIGAKVKVYKNYFLNTQLYLYMGCRSIAKTSSTFKVTDYILPGIRFSIDRSIRDKQ